MDWRNGRSGLYATLVNIGGLDWEEDEDDDSPSPLDSPWTWSDDDEIEAIEQLDIESGWRDEPSRPWYRGAGMPRRRGR